MKVKVYDKEKKVTINCCKDSTDYCPHDAYIFKETPTKDICIQSPKKTDTHETLSISNNSVNSINYTKQF